MSLEFVGDHIGAKPTHLIAIEGGRIVTLRATCGGRRGTTVADPVGAIRGGQHMHRPLPAVVVFVAGGKWYAAPTLVRLRALVDECGPGRVGHRACLNNHASTVACGLDHGDCGASACLFSERHAGNDVEAAWLSLNVAHS